MKKLFIISLVIIFISCARKYYITDEFRKGVPPGFEKIKLDSSYRLYIREVYKDESTPGNYKVKENVTAVNAATDKLIEIEYLLVSFEKQNTIYISTIPDKFQNYYAKKSKYLQRQQLNTYDFSTFSFGKINASNTTIEFNNTLTNHKDTWKFTLTGDSLHVYQAEERVNNDPTNIYLVDEALSKPALFMQLENFEIAFRNMDKEKREETRKGRPPLLRCLIDSAIYFKTNTAKPDIYFRFDRNITGTRDSTVKFLNKRMHNQPSVLLPVQ